MWKKWRECSCGRGLVFFGVESPITNPKSLTIDSNLARFGCTWSLFESGVIYCLVFKVSNKLNKMKKIIPQDQLVIEVHDQKKSLHCSYHLFFIFLFLLNKKEFHLKSKQWLYNKVLGPYNEGGKNNIHHSARPHKDSW